MASISNEARRTLLGKLRLGGGQGEHDVPNEQFVPIEEHLRAMDPSVVLIVGDRGSGKTFLNRALLDPQLRQALYRFAPAVREVRGEASWTAGFPLNREGPTAQSWERFAANHGSEELAVRDLWRGFLLRTLRSHLPQPIPTAVQRVLEVESADAEACFAAIRSAGDQIDTTMDRLDRALEATQQWLFVSYDELDTLLEEDWSAFGRVIRGLISLWTAYSRRWRSIRAKVFLRSDFYGRFTDVVGADIAKLAANRVELSWSDRYLLTVLLRRFGSAEPLLRQYAERGGVRFRRDDLLGYLPEVAKPADARPFLERLCGPFMGANSNKGRSSTWILNAIRDGNGRASPRSLLLLVEKAAEKERATPRARGTQLLHHISLRNALDDVSAFQIDLALGAEWRWLRSVKDALADEPEVPWERRDLERLLRPVVSEAPGRGRAAVKIHGLSPAELVDYLIELGVFRGRTGNRIDVPDLYLRGLGLLRRGGVRRR